MQNKETVVVSTDFENEVRKGLTDYPKHLSSRFIYDEKGDRLFQQIMAMPEYYLTNCEYEILSDNTKEIANYFSENNAPFSLFELGAGDGKKTKILLKYLSDNGFEFDYRPIDISQNALDLLEESVHIELPLVHINPIQGTYFETLANIGAEQERKKVILFLGSNIGNLLHPQAIDFLKNLNESMNPGDLFFIGMDQKKNPQTILDAYNDAAGITENFNKNLLQRINTELGGNFNLDCFLHWEAYDPESGTAKSYLVSKEAQSVRIAHLNLTVEFNAWETIHTEISQKYNDQVVQWLVSKADLKIMAEFTDSKAYYKNYIITKK